MSYEPDTKQTSDFIEAFEKWKRLIPPVGDLGDCKRGSYSIDLDLDHEVSYLRGLGARVRDTRVNWSIVARKAIGDVETIERNVDSASISENEKNQYRTYLRECRTMIEMASRLPVPQAGHLGFKHSTLESFAFLMSDYAFRVTETTPIAVRFTSDSMFVNVSYSPQSPTLSMEVGQLPFDESVATLNLDDLGYVAGLGLTFNYQRFDLNDETGLADFLQTAGSLLGRRT